MLLIRNKKYLDKSIDKGYEIKYYIKVAKNKQLNVWTYITYILRSYFDCKKSVKLTIEING